MHERSPLGNLGCLVITAYLYTGIAVALAAPAVWYGLSGSIVILKWCCWGWVFLVVAPEVYLVSPFLRVFPLLVSSCPWWIGLPPFVIVCIPWAIFDLPIWLGLTISFAIIPLFCAIWAVSQRTPTQSQ